MRELLLLLTVFIFSFASAQNSLSYSRQSGVYTYIYRITEDEVWILYHDKLLIFNSDKERISSLIDLSQWKPHRAVADGQKLWVINREDGLLYGLDLNQ